MKELEDFLNAKLQIEAGILQEFIEPRDEKNFVLQVYYTPRVVTVEKRVSKFPIGNREIDVHERLCTFDGPLEFSHPVQNNEAQCLMVKRMADKIAKHVFNVTFSLHIIQNFYMYFKIDHQNRVWFQYGLNFLSSSMMANTQVWEAYQQLDKPTQVQCSRIRNIITTNEKNPQSLRKDHCCLNCRQFWGLSEFVEIENNQYQRYQIETRRAAPGDNPVNEEVEKMFRKHQSALLNLNGPLKICYECYLLIMDFFEDLENQEARRPSLPRPRALTQHPPKNQSPTQKEKVLRLPEIRLAQSEEKVKKINLKYLEKFESLKQSLQDSKLQKKASLEQKKFTVFNERLQKNTSKTLIDLS